MRILPLRRFVSRQNTVQSQLIGHKLSLNSDLLRFIPHDSVMFDIAKTNRRIKRFTCWWCCTRVIFHHPGYGRRAISRQELASATVFIVLVLKQLVIHHHRLALLYLPINSISDASQLCIRKFAINARLSTL